jgi:hypothetical protein
MRTQLAAVFALGVTSLTLVPGAAPAAPQTPPAGDKPAAAKAQATEDIIYMRDGRVLHGQIIEENSQQVVFEYRDKNINVKTKLTLRMADVAEVQRDVPVTAATAAPAEDESAASEQPEAAASASSSRKVDYKPSYGAAQFSTSDTSVPSLYIVPMHGQFGTDVRSDVYKPVIEDIKKNKPTMVIIDMRSADAFPPELMHPMGFNMENKDPRLERSLLEFEDYRELIHLFRDEIRDVPQVVWINDSDGISATVAMAWDKMYMKPEARFGGLITVLRQSNADKWADSDVRAKMMAAWLGMAKSFVEKGGYSLALADAMLQPEKVLSGSWKGRQIEWSLDKAGEYVVDDNEKRTVDFTAKTAEDLCISQGTAADLDDLALLLGYREYRVIEGKQNDLTVEYVAAWRRAFAQCEQWMEDYQKHISWAGEDPVKWLGKAKSDLENVLRKLDQYKAVEIRLQRDYGLDRITLITYIEQLKEQLQALRQRNRGNAGGGAGRAGGGGNGGGRGGGGGESPG